jgi:hypothetical protein
MTGLPALLGVWAGQNDGPDLDKLRLACQKRGRNLTELVVDTATKCRSPRSIARREDKGVYERHSLLCADRDRLDKGFGFDVFNRHGGAKDDHR